MNIDFYYKEDCHLCEKMQSELECFLDQSGYRRYVLVVKKDIEDDREWFDRYQEYVPMLVLDNEEICYYFFDEEAVSEALSMKIPPGEVSK